MGLTKRELFIPLAVALIVRVAMLPFAQITSPIFWEYGDIARHMLHGQGYSFTWITPLLPSFVTVSAFMPPGQTVIQFLGLKLFGDGLGGYLVIFFFQVGCGVAFTYLVGSLTSKLFADRRVVLLGLWAAAVYPSFVYATATFGVASTVLLLNVAFLLAAVHLYEAIAAKRSIRTRVIQLGVVAGLLGYFRAEAPLPVIATLALILWMQRKNFSRAVGPVLGVLLLFVAIQAPWTIRNYRTFDSFIPGSTSGGFNLWKGNSDLATGSGWDDRGIIISPTLGTWMKVYEAGPIGPQFEVHFSEVLRNEATTWISAHPAKAAILAAKKIFMLWTVDRYNRLSSNWLYALLTFGTTVLLITGFLSRRNGSQHDGSRSFGTALIGVWCLIYTALAAVFFVVPRYQIFMIGCYWPFVALGLSRIVYGRQAHISNAGVAEARIGEASIAAQTVGATGVGTTGVSATSAQVFIT